MQRREKSSELRCARRGLISASVRADAPLALWFGGDGKTAGGKSRVELRCGPPAGVFRSYRPSAAGPWDGWKRGLFNSAICTCRHLATNALLARRIVLSSGMPRIAAKSTKDEAEKAIRHLCGVWFAEANLTPAQRNHPSYMTFKSWLDIRSYGHYLDFRSNVSADHDAELWFDQEFRLTGLR